MADKYLVVIGGPTGVGKTATAIALAQRLATGIINADSRQVYKELNIGVGKPGEAQLKMAPHHLIGHVSIKEPYDVARFTADALETIQHLFEKKDYAILCGGTGLYLKSVMTGLDDFPEIPSTVTTRWTSSWKEKGTALLAQMLQDKDPEYAAHIDLRNHMRLIRALSVIDHTGATFSSFLNQPKTPRPFISIPILLDLPRKQLYQQINQRVLEMLDSGWVEEARSLYPYRDSKALKTVGYAELFAWMDGQATFEETIDAIQQSTRRYAKRQLTWFRNQGDWKSFHPDDVEGVLKEIKVG